MEHFLNEKEWQVRKNREFLAFYLQYVRSHTNLQVLYENKTFLLLIDYENDFLKRYYKFYFFLNFCKVFPILWKYPHLIPTNQNNQVLNSLNKSIFFNICILVRNIFHLHIWEGAICPHDSLLKCFSQKKSTIFWSNIGHAVNKKGFLWNINEAKK